MEFLKTNWDWIASSPWLVASLALTFFLLGWAAAQLFYKERIELLKEKKNSKSTTTAEPNNITYPQSGRHGKNILANSLVSVIKNEKLTMRAEIPRNSNLVLEIKGPKPIHKQDNESSWLFSSTKIHNWSNSTYEFENGGRQEFIAEEGIADMEIWFAREGEVIITAYHRDERSPAWSKHLTVRC
jgi:hypothetical protein